MTRAAEPCGAPSTDRLFSARLLSSRKVRSIHGKLPDLQGLVVTNGGDPVTVGTERDAVDLLAVPAERTQIGMAHALEVVPQFAICE